MAKPDGTGTTLEESFRYAFRGAFLPLKERNMQIHISAALLALAVGLFFKISAIEWCAIVIVIGKVITAETQNSSIEDTVDLCYTGKHPRARDAKDKAAGAVLYAAITAVIVGGIIFIPKIMGYLLK